MPVFCWVSSPRRSRSGPMQAQTEPQARPFLSSSALTCFGSMWDGSSRGISTDWKPHFLNFGKSFVLSLVNGEVKRKVLIPNLIIVWPEAMRQNSGVEIFWHLGRDPRIAPFAVE